MLKYGFEMDECIQITRKPACDPAVLLCMWCHPEFAGAARVLARAAAKLFTRFAPKTSYVGKKGGVSIPGSVTFGDWVDAAVVFWSKRPPQGRIQPDQVLKCFSITSVCIVHWAWKLQQFLIQRKSASGFQPR